MVVIGGMGSIVGAFVAAILVSLKSSALHRHRWLAAENSRSSFVFLADGGRAVIARRGACSAGRRARARASGARDRNAVAAARIRTRVLAALALLAIAALLPAFLGAYGLAVATEVAIFVLFATSLHLSWVRRPASFGHAAFSDSALWRGAGDEGLGLSMGSGAHRRPARGCRGRGARSAGSR